MNRWLTLLLAVTCFFAGDACALGRTVFFSGFEGACNLASDGDDDRLDDCAEAGLKLDAANADTDGDGLADGDEVLGTKSGLALPAFGVDPRHKNVLVEYDWFDEALGAGSGVTCPAGVAHSHRPEQAALDRVTVAFAAAPVSNPDGTQGIDIIHDIGQGGVFDGGSAVPAGDGVVDGTVTEPEYFDYYRIHFATNRRGYFHYALMPHQFLHMDGVTTYSGSGQVVRGYRRDRIMVSLACGATVSRVGNTIMHELGHNFGLQHGGDSECLGKPNYNSVMNYLFQFPGVDIDCNGTGDGVLDFSAGKRVQIDENAIDESRGVCGTVPIDFTAQNGIETSVKSNLNLQKDEVALCGGTFTVLKDHDDWGALQLGVDAVVNAGNGGALDIAAVCGAEP